MLCAVAVLEQAHDLQRAATPLETHLLGESAEIPQPYPMASLGLLLALQKELTGRDTFDASPPGSERAPRLHGLAERRPVVRGLLNRDPFSQLSGVQSAPHMMMV